MQINRRIGCASRVSAIRLTFNKYWRRCATHNALFVRSVYVCSLLTAPWLIFKHRNSKEFPVPHVRLQKSHKKLRRPFSFYDWQSSTLLLPGGIRSISQSLPPLVRLSECVCSVRAVSVFIYSLNVSISIYLERTHTLTHTRQSGKWFKWSFLFREDIGILLKIPFKSL